MSVSRLRAGSIRRPLSGTCITSHPSCICLRAEEREVLVSASESEEVVKVKDRWRFFRPCRWINRPFMYLRVLAEGAVAVEAAASEAENGCIPGGAVVGGEVGSGR